VKKAGDIVSYTAEELRAMIARGEDQTDWARVDAMTEAELEAAVASDPDWADVPRDWYKHATSPHPEALRKQVRLRLDLDLLAWFKRQGPGYQARINVALRAFVEAHQRTGREEGGRLSCARAPRGTPGRRSARPKSSP
jgi:uncharacterized protein (DUF4415 family)